MSELNGRGGSYRCKWWWVREWCATVDAVEVCLFVLLAAGFA